MLTLDDALKGTEFWHVSATNADKTPARCRRNGAGTGRVHPAARSGARMKFLGRRRLRALRHLKGVRAGSIPARSTTRTTCWSNTMSITH